MIITFNQSSGLDNASFTTAWTPVAQVTYWTLGTAAPEGGYATPEDGTTLPQNSLSSDGGLTSYDYLSPDLNSPITLGSIVLPVLFTNFDTHCTNNSALVSWSTASESNSNYFELQRSTNGNEWTSVSTIKEPATVLPGVFINYPTSMAEVRFIGLNKLILTDTLFIQVSLEQIVK